MITKHDLQEAIAECQGTRSPNANTAIKLAAFLTILDHMEEEDHKSKTSPIEYAIQPGTVSYKGSSDFAKAIDGKTQKEVFTILDDLMDTIRALNERLYDGVMRKLQ